MPGARTGGGASAACFRPTKVGFSGVGIHGVDWHARDTGATCCASLASSSAFLRVRATRARRSARTGRNAFLRRVCPAALSSSWGSDCYFWLWSARAARACAYRVLGERRGDGAAAAAAAAAAATDVAVRALVFSFVNGGSAFGAAWLFSGAVACCPAYHRPWCSRVVLPPPRLGRPAAAPRWRSPAVHDGSGLLARCQRHSAARDPCSFFCGGFMPLHWRVHRAWPPHCALRPRSSLAALLWAARGEVESLPAGGGLVHPPVEPARARFHLVCKPGGGGRLLLPRVVDQGVFASPRAVSRTARPRRRGPPLLSFANPPSRRSDLAAPPLWCSARWSAPACLAAVGERGRVTARESWYFRRIWVRHNTG